MAWDDAVQNLQGAASRVFGREQTYEPDGLPSLTLPGIFRDQSVEVDPETGAGQLVAAPAIEVRRADLPRDPIGIDETGVRDVVIVDGTRYALTTWEDDGFGMLTLSLRLES